MNRLMQPFRFPKKLWLVASGVCFLYLFFAAAVNYKGDQPTAWRSLLEGEIGMGVVFGVFWLLIAFAFGALVASIFGIIRQLLWRGKLEKMQAPSNTK